MFNSEKEVIETYKTSVSESWRSNIFSICSSKNEKSEIIFQIYLDSLVVSEVLYSADEARDWIYIKLKQIIETRISKLKIECNLLENDLKLTKESFIEKHKG